VGVVFWCTYHEQEPQLSKGSFLGPHRAPPFADKHILSSQQTATPSCLRLCLAVAMICSVLAVEQRYTHKTSGFKTSGFKTSETSDLQNVRFTKHQVYKTSGLQNVSSSKHQVFKTSSCKKTSIYILYLWLVEIRRFCCSHVCRQSDGRVLFSILEVFLPYITMIPSNK
jgi:hypothetical protein